MKPSCAQSAGTQIISTICSIPLLPILIHLLLHMFPQAAVNVTVTIPSANLVTVSCAFPAWYISIISSAANTAAITAVRFLPSARWGDVDFVMDTVKAGVTINNIIFPLPITVTLTNTNEIHRYSICIPVVGLFDGLSKRHNNQMLKREHHMCITIGIQR